MPPFKRRLQILMAVLILQGSGFYAVAFRAETAPPALPLSSFPTDAPGWKMERDLPIESEILEKLRADDVLNRAYVNDGHTEEAYFFIAYFKTQRDGQTPHSPKNCLPGSGWQPLESGTIDIPVSGWIEPVIHPNRYVVEHGDEREVTIYWYQSHNRIISGEFAAKFWLVADALRYRRSDSSIVKVIVPVHGDTEQATRTAVQFVQAVFPTILLRLPK